MSIIDGKALAQQIRSEIREHLQNYDETERPTLACILVGNNPASQTYVKQKEKACLDCGINSKIINLDEYSSCEDVRQCIMELNNNSSISGILLQLPLPAHLEEYRSVLINTISPYKDVDCLTDYNLGRVMSGDNVIAPCTATGVMRIIDSVNYNLAGKQAVVLGRSILVGKPVSQLLLARNATVTMCHSKTKNLSEITKQADVLVVAINQAEFITKEHVKPGAFVVDVGIHRTSNGLIGDVNTNDVKDICNYITPVPGGVGPLTVACLMENTVILHELSHNINYDNYASKFEY